MKKREESLRDNMNCSDVPPGPRVLNKNLIFSSVSWKNEELSSISNLQNASVLLISLYLYFCLPFRLTECLWKMSTTNLNNHILTAVAAKIEQRKQRKCIDFQVWW